MRLSTHPALVWFLVLLALFGIAGDPVPGEFLSQVIWPFRAKT